MKKRLLSVLLCTVMLVGLLPTGIFAITAAAEEPGFVKQPNAEYGTPVGYMVNVPFTFTEAPDSIKIQKATEVEGMTIWSNTTMKWFMPSVGNYMAEIKAQSTACTEKYRIVVLFGSNEVRSNPFTVTWYSYELTLQPTSKTVLKGESAVVSFDYDFPVEDISLYFTSSEGKWKKEDDDGNWMIGAGEDSQKLVIDRPPVEDASSMEYYIQLIYKNPATEEEETLSSDPFTVTWQTVIEEVTVNKLDTPIIGRLTDVTLAVPEDANYSLAGFPVWYEKGTGKPLDVDARYEAGKGYAVKIVLKADKDFIFTEDTVEKMDGFESSQVTLAPSEDQTELTMTVMFDAAEEEKAAFLAGDANGDESVDMKDVLVIRKYVAGLPGTLNLAAADTNGDENVDMKDVLMLRKYIAKLVDELAGGVDDDNLVASKVWVCKADGSSYMQRAYEFDGNGRYTEAAWYNEDGSLRNRSELTYDENGNLVTDKQYDADGKLTDKQEYTYDADGRRIAGKFYKGDGSLESSYEITYNENGNRTGQVFYDSKGKVDSRIEYTYDENGNRIRQRDYDADGNVVWGYCEDATYDENGNQLTVTYYDDEGKANARYEYAYDENGNRIKINRYDGDGSLLWYRESTYDENGNCLTETAYNADGTLDTFSEAVYNEAGMNLQWRVYDENGDPIWSGCCDYNFSKSGRSLDMRQYENDGTLKSVTEYEYVEISSAA